MVTESGRSEGMTTTRDGGNPQPDEGRIDGIEDVSPDVVALGLFQFPLTHGDVTEPFLNAIPDPPSVFAAYTAGRTLGESLWAGLSEIVWKEIVIGDPLCKPY